MIDVADAMLMLSQTNIHQSTQQAVDIDHALPGISVGLSAQEKEAVRSEWICIGSSIDLRMLGAYQQGWRLCCPCCQQH